MKPEIIDLVGKVEKKFDYKTIDLSNIEDNAILIYLLYYEITDFQVVFSKLSKLLKKGTERQSLVNEYVFSYKALRKTIIKQRRSVAKDETVVLVNETIKNNDILLNHSTYHKEESLTKNIKRIILRALEIQLTKTNEKIYLFEKHPHVFKNEIINHLDENCRLRWEKEILIYKDVYISHVGHHRFGIHSNSQTSFETINAIINIFSYLNCHPVYILTNNSIYNQKLSNIYSEFDILDMLQLRNKRFFGKGLNESIQIEPTIFRLNKKYHHTILPDCSHERIFDLYQSSLKQIEPLPRCVFLYRILEYGISFHYQKQYKNATNMPITAIDYYAQQALNFNFIPVYFIDNGFSSNFHEGTFNKARKIAMCNLTSILKKEAKKIIHEWSSDSYLGNKTIGEILYKTGRNRVAHGANGQYNSKYDYSKNYLHINNVNILLELIARYIIEILYPDLAGHIEKNKKLYIFNSYQKKDFIDEGVIEDVH
ncbi:hypothetical protein [Carboxylicivirga sp. RSCT41]|uniref:hypothetical protein n=1 Tax=Carboxylicivirga agarovorans TaxID=3417570 RepID=UPI003D336794